MAVRLANVEHVYEDNSFWVCVNADKTMTNAPVAWEDSCAKAVTMKMKDVPATLIVAKCARCGETRLCVRVVQVAE